MQRRDSNRSEQTGQYRDGSSFRTAGSSPACEDASIESKALTDRAESPAEAGFAVKFTAARL
ncbi:MAG: hypothetical protein DMG41_30425 [Acidobacteria bacterium]|nr:MAG: hypothetical protein AUH13_01685 [Acidobacteria bacterium 13_2_20CM_58_27]PYT76619.1 MAG: hypothetical protein DMG42_04540 [Acidobacteriota bacterium]PYT83611.1 MAG: hypothetical protein DMG41_30425 [Acidobacteriota bacterium]